MKNILVTDDHADTNRIVCRLLRSRGYRTASAFTGEDALAAVTAECPDLLILDIMMPEMDGIEVLRRLRANPATANLPVIVLSAMSDPQSHELARQNGATAYCVKGSLDFGQFAKIVAECIELVTT